MNRILLVCVLIGVSSRTGVTLAQGIAAAEEGAFRAAAALVAPSVVSIETVGGLETIGEVLVGTGPASGLIVGDDGYVVSSTFNFAHKPASIVVTLADGTRVPARLVARDETRHIVLLKIDVPRKLAVPQAAAEAEIAVGMWSIAVGRTFEADRTNMSVGIVSAVNRIWGKAIQTDAKISPANYGGPLVDVRGRVLGVLVPMSPNEKEEISGVEWYDSGIGFAVPLEHVFNVLPRLKAGENLKPGVVGVRFKGPNLYGDPPIIAHARANSPAYKAGLRKGDVIRAVEGRPVDLQAQVMEQVQRRYAGDTLRFTVARGDEMFERAVELVEKLDPYKRPFLGFLPRRAEPDDANPGVAVRFVYEKSPAAERGLKVGDRVLAVGGRAVKDRDALMLAVAESEPGRPVALEISRDGTKQTLELQPVSQPETIPSSLPRDADRAASPEEPKAEAKLAPLKFAEFQNDCERFVPDTYDDAVAHGLVVLIYRNGRASPDKSLVKRWQTACRAERLILLVPRAAEEDGWTRTDLEFLENAIDRTAEEYRVDPQRIVAHGIESGGAFAAAAAANLPERIRAVAVVNSSSLAGAVENEPAAPLSFYAASEPGFPGKAKLKANVEQLRERFFPVTTRELAPGADYPSDEQFTELLRWIDSLDRI